MARLENINGIYFDIKPVAYQFARGKDSLNWLQIQLRASDGKFAWKATDPAFENHELSALVHWLRQLVVNDPAVKMKFYATEPCVEFAARRVKGRIELTVLLGCEFLPPQMKTGKNSYSRKVRLTFIDDGRSFLRFACELEKELEPFPVRKEPDVS